jgi:predicted ATP-binding protein involved in virulence
LLIDGENRRQYPFNVQLVLSTSNAASYEPYLRSDGNGLHYSRKDESVDLSSYLSELVSSSRTRSGVMFPLVAYYGTKRLCRGARKSQEWSRKDTEGFDRGYLSCLTPHVDQDIFLGWFRAYEWEAEKFDQPLDRALLKAMKSAISEMVPDWQDITYSFKDDGLFGTTVDSKGQKQRLDFFDLSDGYQSTIAMVADMAYRCIQLNPHLGENAVKETPGIVLIDELDLHLHPNWQRNIVADLKRVFPKVQFIATTHSPFIVQSLRELELIVLDENPELGGDPYKRSIEDIAETEMGVEEGPRSEKFSQMVNVAEEYLGLIANGHSEYDEAKKNQLREQLNDFEELFGEDPIFVAMLRLERKAKKI